MRNVLRREIRREVGEIKKDVANIKTEVHRDIPSTTSASQKSNVEEKSPVTEPIAPIPHTTETSTEKPGEERVA
jgi:hypothetical protein